MMAESKLVSAVRLALPVLPRLVGPAVAADVGQRLRDIIARFEAGQDVELELLDVVASNAALRHLVRELTTPRRAVTRGGTAGGTRGAAELRSDGASPPTARFVNTLVAEPGGDAPVSHGLEPGAQYEVLVHIGRYLENSLLAAEDAVWPEEDLPPGGLWLRAVLTTDEDESPVVRTVFLAEHGESFSCGCPVSEAHTAECEARAWTRLPFRTPRRSGVLHAELVIYYEVVAVHAQSLTLPLSVDAPAPQARLMSRLTRNFADLGKLTGRSASLVSMPGTSRVLVNGVGFADNPFALSPSAADTAVLNSRQVLYDSHFDIRADAEYSVFDGSFGKDEAGFEADLRRLARTGAELYSRLFSTLGTGTAVVFSLPELLRHEALMRCRPPVLHVADDQYDERSILWATVYDLPMGGDVSRYEPCPAVSEFGPGGSAGDPPAFCPYGEAHRGQANILCPWGFWGLSCVLEQPFGMARRPGDVISYQRAPVTCLVAAGDGLDPGLLNTHLTRLRDQLGRTAVLEPALPSERELAAALAPENMDVVYFYCHCGYDLTSAGAAANRYLGLTGFRIEPLDIAAWARTAWPYPHWPNRRPLILLNGCHTVEATSGTLNAFVPAFTQWAGASGVVGTEVTVEQGLAGWVAEELLTELADGATVGDAVRTIRWRMFGRGNVMGMAYTPYCLSNLVLRPLSAQIKRHSLIEGAVMAQSQPVMSVGALCFGVSVGFIAYRTLIRTASKAEISDIATVVAAVGGGAVTGLFQPNTDLFGWYAIGLLVGMAFFFVLYLIMNGRQKLAKVMSGETVGAAPSAGTSRGPHL